MPSLLDEAFSLLDQANALEQKASRSNSCSSNEAAGEGSSSTESLDYGSLLTQASTKYHEACYLIKRHLGRNNGERSDAEKMRSLLVEKIEHYEHHAEELMKRVKDHRVERSPGFTIERNVSPNSSWENKHASQLEPARSNVLAPNKNHIQNEAAVQASSKASALLSTAIKLDESGENSKATEQYLAAAQLYLDAVKTLSEDNANVDLITSLKHKVQLTLDRVEELKKRKKIDCDEINRKLTLLTARQDLPSANKEKPDCEEINKKLASLESIHEESLTPFEVEVLKRSSLLASGLFLPWCDEEAKTYNYFTHSSPWIDPDGLLVLSEKQRERFCKWARPSEIVQMNRYSSHEIKMIDSVDPFTIKQYCVSDCSFIAGLCIAASHERRFNKRIISSLIYPQDESGNPIYNPNGVYMIKLWLNGVARRVLVDDLLPIDRKGKLLCSHIDCRLNRSKRKLNQSGSGSLELWVSILEKAYMKLCGGYDFPGSNSGIDLFSLTGWIPERIFFPADETNVKDFETPVERVWERVYR
jgi:calpain-7